VAVALLSLLGCGGKTPVTLQGKFVAPPATKVKLAETDQVEIRFVPEDGKGQAGAATFSAKDAAFTVPKVLPGKYKVVITVNPYSGSPKSEERKHDLKKAINERYSEKDSKLSVTIPDQPLQQSVTVDLTKDSVTPG